VQPESSHPALTLILSIWAGVGPLVGLLTGTFLQMRIARNQWLRDNRKQECRELMGALSAASVALGYWYLGVSQLQSRFGVVDEHLNQAVAERLKHYIDLNTTLQMLFVDRLFIYEEVRDAEIRDRWNAIVDEHGKTMDYAQLKVDTEAICSVIRNMAVRSLPR
jgi:hypothetical protein